MAETHSGLQHIASRPFQIAVQMGQVPGYSIISKFAENPDIQSGTPADLWDFGDDSIVGNQVSYTFSASAAIDSISSDNAGDTQVIVVIGLDDNFDQVTQTKVLTGQTRAALDTPLRRVIRAFNGNGTATTGNVYIYENTALTTGKPTDTTKIRAYISIIEQQTLLGVYTVPRGFTGFFLGLSASISKQPSAGNLIFTGKARTPGGVFRTQIRFNLSSTGSSARDILATANSPFPEMTDFVAHGAVSTNGTGASVTFDLMLIENTHIPNYTR